MSKVVKTGVKLANPGALLGIGKDPVSELLYGGKGGKVDPVLTMPLADDEAVRMARKRSISAQMKRGGRSSTILSDDAETFG